MAGVADVVADEHEPGSARAPGTRSGQRAVGMVGAGQLARMTAEAASALDIDLVVLAEHADDAAVPTASSVVLGSPRVESDLRGLARHVEVVTFDHELVDLRAVDRLEHDGVHVRPGSSTLALAVDKGRMRHVLGAAGLPMPAHRLLATPDITSVEAFAEAHGWPLVLKAARGGYDGRGVWPVADRAEAADICARLAAAGTEMLVEEHVQIDAEVAVLVARRPGGESVAWPAVETAQAAGVCREILVPGRLDPSVLAAASRLGHAVASGASSVGVLAVELFVRSGELLVNEIAARPHNSGHWTIEGAATSQFENHLRAVLDLPLGDTTPSAPAVACVNVFGAADGLDPSSRLAGALAVAGAHVHLYGKKARPGRKLGHVTVCGEDPEDVRSRAWAAARALGTPGVPGTAEDADPSDRVGSL